MAARVRARERVDRDGRLDRAPRSTDHGAAGLRDGRAPSRGASGRDQHLDDDPVAAQAELPGIGDLGHLRGIGQRQVHQAAVHIRGEAGRIRALERARAGALLSGGER